MVDTWREGNTGYAPGSQTLQLVPEGLATLNPSHDMTARCRPVGCVGKVEQTEFGLAVHTLGIIHKLYIFTILLHHDP